MQTVTSTLANDAEAVRTLALLKKTERELRRWRHARIQSGALLRKTRRELKWWEARRESN